MNPDTRETPALGAASGSAERPNIDYVQHLATALKALMDDPHPGLASWQWAYGTTMQKLSDFWNSDRSPNAVVSDGSQPFAPRPGSERKS